MGKHILEGPTEVEIRSDAVACCYYALGKPLWLLKRPPADFSWRELLDLPASLEPGLTLGKFISLFDIRDPSLDERLFSSFTSIRHGPFRRWVAALSEEGIPPVPRHVVAAEIEAPVRISRKGAVQFQERLALHLISEGHVEDDFWGDSQRFPWVVYTFPIAQVRELPLKLATVSYRWEGQERVVSWSPSFRQLIHVVFDSCPPANRESDLLPAERFRWSDEIQLCTESLEEMLGLERSGPN